MAKEERMKKYNNFIEELKSISKIPRIKKISERKASEEVLMNLK